MFFKNLKDKNKRGPPATKSDPPPMLTSEELLENTCFVEFVVGGFPEDVLAMEGIFRIAAKMSPFTREHLRDLKIEEGVCVFLALLRVVISFPSVGHGWI